LVTNRWILLALFVSLASCWPKKEVSGESKPADSAPLDPRMLEPPPSAEQNLGGAETHDAIDDEDAMVEPMPPASPGSPYNSSSGPPPPAEK
jgi:hypothetical protein